MPLSTVKLVAYMADSAILPVTADQRDFAKWEVQPYADAVVTRLRFLAWSAAYRTKAYKGSWTEFNEIDCIEVNAPGDAVGESDGLDPGNPETSATG